MKHVFLLLAITAITANAQKTTPFILESGFGDFVLHANKESFGNDIRFVDSLSFKGVKEYFYVHSFNAPLDIAGIQFLFVILTFDESNKLIQIELTKIYTKALFTNHKKRASSDQKALNTFLLSQAGTKGKKKSKFYTLNASGYEWAKGNVLIWAFLQTTTTIGEKKSEHYSISLLWKFK